MKLHYYFLLLTCTILHATDHRGERFVSQEWQDRKHYFYTHSVLPDPLLVDDALKLDDIVFVKKNINKDLRFCSTDMDYVRSLEMAKLLVDHGVVFSDIDSARCKNPRCKQNLLFSPAIVTDSRLILFYWSKGVNTQKKIHGLTPITYLLQEAVSLTAPIRKAVRLLIAIGVPVKAVDTEKSCDSIIKEKENTNEQLLTRATIAQAHNEVANAHEAMKEAVEERLSKNKNVAKIVAGYVGHQCPDFVFEELDKIEKEK